MAKKDIDMQIKKRGKIEDCFICLPDPEDAYTWYFVVFGLDYNEYKGGFYMGKILCPPEYPAKAPRIYLLTDNGRFKTDKTGYADGICLSVSHYHPESWNPVWKVNQIVIGLVSFWVSGESTAGAIYPGETQPKGAKFGETESDARIEMAKKSRELVLNHEKFFIFKDYADQIGISSVPEVDGWKAHSEKMAEVEAKIEEKKKADEEKRRQEEERKRIEEERKKKEEEERLEQEKIKKMKQIPADFFKQMKKMGMTNYVGQKNKLQ